MPNSTSVLRQFRPRRAAAVVLSLLASFPVPQTAQAEGSWSPSPNLLSSRRQLAAVVLQDGRVLVTGGDGYEPSGEYAVHRSTEIFDPAVGSWAPGPEMLVPRESHSATVLADGRVLVIGGGSSDINRSAEILDVATMQWSALPTLPATFWNPRAELLPDGRVFVTGGAVTGSAQTAFLFHPRTGVWSRTAPAPSAGFRASALLGDGRVLLAGGLGSDGNVNPRQEAVIYDPARDRWTPTGLQSVQGIDSATLAPTADGGALLATNCCERTYVSVCPLSSQQCTLPTPRVIRRFHPGSDGWTLTAPTARPRRHGESISLADGSVLALGGRRLDPFGRHEMGVDRWDPATNLWTPVGDLSWGRSWFDVVRLLDGRVMVIGGDNDDGDHEILRSVDLYTP